MSAAVVSILKNGQPVRSVTLDSSEAVLGRGDGCLIRLDDRAVSRQHAVIKVTSGGISIEKKSRLAPLMVNGQECDSAELREGDQILIGPYLIQVSLPVANSSNAPVLEERLNPRESGDPEEKSGIALDLAGSNVELDSGAVGGPGLELVAVGEEVPPEIASQEVPQSIEELSSLIGEADKTKVLPSESVVRLKIIVEPGLANITSHEFDQDEISVGRGQGCDIVLQDKKASRKHLVIRRSGSGVETEFVIKDLESANGVFVNGARISEHVLSGDDIVQVGDTSFLVQAVLPGYEQKEKEFLKVQTEAGAEVAGIQPVEVSDKVDQVASEFKPEGVIGVSGIGVSTGGESKQAPSWMALIERFRTMPPRSRLIWILFVGVALYSLLDFIPSPKRTSPRQAKKVLQKKDPSKAGLAQGLPTLDQLPPDLRKFVDSQYNLAVEYFRNRDYDTSIHEVRKIFQYVSDYPDARDLERYAIEGKKRLEAQEEEKRRKEIETANKARVAKLVVEVEGHMARKEYIQARELFAEISTIEPDHPQISIWRREIEDFEELQRRDQQLKKFEQESQERARELLAAAAQALKGGKWFKAIDIYRSVFALELKDKKLVGQAEAGVARAKAKIASVRDPHIQEGKAREGSGSYSEAFKSYESALQIDPSSQAAQEGADRMRVFLRDKARQLYTEAVLAESYSDYEVAKSKFQELLEVVPQDDPYHARAKRKLSRYLAEE